jgi:penicillin-binding protein 2
MHWKRLSLPHRATIASVRRGYTGEIDPENIFLDASNLGNFDTNRMEGRVEYPVSRRALVVLGVAFTITAAIFSGRAYYLQVQEGGRFATIAKENSIARSLVFAERGIIYDRTGKELAWNEPGESFATRAYSDLSGLAHVLGYVRYPKADSRGLWWRTEYSGVAGAEYVFDDVLSGTNGEEMVEVDALGKVTRGYLINPPKNGKPMTLSIDAELTSVLHDILARHITNNRFLGGASIIMDVTTGEIIAITSVPEFSPQLLTNGEGDAIRSYTQDSRTPFLDRAIGGAYTPGSIVKPLFASAALNEHTITPLQSIFSPGYISIPNPYDPSNPTIMKDWRAHGWTNMRQAIAVSSDVYFYAIGGGYQNQPGLGISRLDSYAHRYGLGEMTGIVLPGEVEGLVPTPEWKESIFGDDPWRLGDTYNTSIGQYGFQVTPVQMVRAVGAIANGGDLMVPQIVASSTPETTALGIPDEYLSVVREGMRLAVSDSSVGTARAINVSGMELAGKTGTAEVGSRKQYMNSWVIGFWPASNPKYAFATVLEKAPAGTLSGAAPSMNPFFYWLLQNRREMANGQ